MTRTFAVIGDPIDHSLSPNIHSAAFRKLNMDCSYIAYRIPRGELDEGIAGLQKIQISGFNVTIPHKISIIKHLDKMDESCSLIGAVNTVENKDGVLKGYNTDMAGFLDPLKKRKICIKDANVLLLGAGGAARAIAAGLAKEKAGNLTIANRTIQGASNLAAFSAELGLDAKPISLEDAKTCAHNSDIIINATSVGMGGEPSLIPPEEIKSNSTIYDIVYMPMNTGLIKAAKSRGAQIIFGYEMLLSQAVRSFEIWHDIEAPHNAMKQALLGGT